MALARPPVQAPTPLGEATLAGVGIVSPRKVWTAMAFSGAALFLVGALVVWVSVTPRGPAAAESPVVIDVADGAGAMPLAAAEEAEEEMPEGAALEALLAQAVPAPSAPEGADLVGELSVGSTASADDDAALAALPEGVAPPPLPRSRRPRRRPAKRTPLPPPATETLTPTPAPSRMSPSPMSPSPMSSPPSSTEGSSPYNAITYGPAARRRVGSRYVGDVQRCFDEADRRMPGFSGTVVMSYVLTPDGRIASSRVVRNTTGDGTLGNCLGQAARRWELPPPPPRTLEFGMSFAR